MTVQKAIFPGIFAGIAFLVLVTSLFRSAAPAKPTKLDTLEVGSISSAGVLDIQINRMENPALPDDGICSISAAYPDAVKQWCGVIERYSNENGLDANLVAAVMLRESSGQPDAYSKSGAVGLMQVMPRDGLAAKFTCKGGPCFANRPSMKDLFDPQYNVAYGSRMLAELVESTGSVRDALKAYGPMDVGYGYADLVLRTFDQHR